jgi:hypothetical protein
MKTEKYFILHNSTTNNFQDFNRDLDKPKKTDLKAPFLLIEKICMPNEGEKINNLYQIFDFDKLQKIVKNTLVYDYTGIVKPLIHIDGQKYTFQQYLKIKY